MKYSLILLALLVVSPAFAQDADTQRVNPREQHLKRLQEQRDALAKKDAEEIKAECLAKCDKQIERLRGGNKEQLKAQVDKLKAKIKEIEDAEKK